MKKVHPTNTKNEPKQNRKSTARLKKELLEHLEKMPIVQTACARTGIARATYYKWRDDAQFALKADRAISTGEKLMTDMAESKLIQHISDGNMTAIIFWLKHHKPIYSDKVNHRVHYEGPPVLSDAEAEKIKKTFETFFGIHANDKFDGHRDEKKETKVISEEDISDD